MKKISRFLFIYILLVTCSQPIFSQKIEVINDRGERILINADGSWEYAEKVANTDNPIVEVKEIAPPIAKKKSKQNSKPVKIKKSETVVVKVKKVKTPKDKTTTARHKPKKTVRDPLTGTVTAVTKEKKTKEKNIKTKQKQAHASIKSSKKAKSPKSNIHHSDSMIAKEFDISENPIPAKTKTKSKTKTKKPTTKPQKVVKKPANSDDPTAILPVKQTPKEKEKTTINQAECQVKTEVDEFRGKTKKMLPSRLFFTYTPDDFKSYMRGQDLLTCSGFLVSSTGGTVTLFLTFTFNTPKAQKSYGNITDGAMLGVKLLNDKNLQLYAIRSDEGKVEGDKTIYTTAFLLDNKDVRELQKSEVSKVRMTWTSGYEEYEVYELDFFTKQFNCLGY